MAGATAELLVPDDSDATLEAWEQIVGAQSTRVEGRDFWVAPEPDDADVGGALPFFWRASYPNDPMWFAADEPAALATLAATFGLTPRMSIGFGAMCRGRPSDRLLGRLAGAFLERQPGVLLFHGLLAPFLDHAEWRSWAAKGPVAQALAFSQRIAGHPGLIRAIPEDQPAYHAVDCAFLGYWRGHPAFHFVN